MHLKDRFITYNEADMPFNGTAGAIPKFDRSGLPMDLPTANKDVFPQAAEIPDVYFRPHTTLESCPDLIHPHFSNCTIPVVLNVAYMANFGGRSLRDGCKVARNMVLAWCPNGKKIDGFSFMHWYNLVCWHTHNLTPGFRYE